MKQDKIKLLSLSLGTILLLLTIVLYGYMAINKGDVNFGTTLAITIPLLIIVFMLFFIVRRYKDIKHGMPFEDERSKKVITMAAAKSFYISLYWLLAISWFESIFADMFGLDKLDASQTVGGGIAGMAVIFFISWFYYNKKDKLI